MTGPSMAAATSALVGLSRQGSVSGRAGRAQKRTFTLLSAWGLLARRIHVSQDLVVARTPMLLETRGGGVFRLQLQTN
jgi:hypothetical protein